MDRKIIESFLAELPSGELTNAQYIRAKAILFDIWEELYGSYDTLMNIRKLGRLENICFEPPATLTFEIERHGQTVHGSVYADLHKWYVNLNDMTASCDQFYKKRVVGKRAKPLNVKPLAESVANALLTNDNTFEFLEWLDENTVKVKISELIPQTNQQTTTSRRKRFRNALEGIILPKGWQTTKVYNKYTKVKL